MDCKYFELEDFKMSVPRQVKFFDNTKNIVVALVNIKVSNEL